MAWVEALRWPLIPGATMQKFVLVDFETASLCDLKRAGAWRYSEDFSTQVLCMGYVFSGANEPGVWKPGDRPEDHAKLFRGMLAQDVFFIAHNVGFEKAIWRNICIPEFGWPDVPNDRWHDTLAVCAQKGIPQQLARALSMLGLSHQKDHDGSRLTISLSKPDKKTGLYGFNKATPEQMERVYEYCARDIHGELELHRRIKEQPDGERAVWLLDQTINERGVRLDLDFVSAGQEICDQATAPLLAEFNRLTGFNPGQRDRVLSWLTEAGARLPDLKKETLDKLLGEEEPDEDSLAGDICPEDDRPDLWLPASCRRPLEIRRVLGSASIKKLAAMRDCVAADGCVRGVLQYHGAGPGRWAGRLLQPQNFPRGTTKVIGAKGKEAPPPEELVAAILTRDAEFVRVVYGEPIEAVASGLRHAIIARRGKELVVGDFATIEARIVLAMSGQHDKVALIASGQDIYCDMAMTIFDRLITKKENPEERHTGKNTVLGCGFQMGPAKFRMRYAPDKDMDFAKKCIDAYRQDFAPLVPKMWYGLEDAAVKAVWDRRPQSSHGVEYRLEDGWLTARLPSGRRLWYYAPRPVRKAMPWDKDDIRMGFEYISFKMGKVRTINAYGGLLTENVVQATARDLLVHAMFNCERENFPISLTVHDEIVAEKEPNSSNAHLLEMLMCDIPGWAKSLKIPVNAEVWTGERYRK